MPKSETDCPICGKHLRADNLPRHMNTHDDKTPRFAMGQVSNVVVMNGPVRPYISAELHQRLRSAYGPVEAGEYVPSIQEMLNDVLTRLETLSRGKK